MQNLYRLLGVPATAAPAVILKAYQQQLLRLRRRRGDRATVQRLDALQAAHDVLLDPGRRWAYDELLAQEPPVPNPVDRYGPYARWLNLALLVFALLLVLDRALPERHYAYEPVLKREVVNMSSSAGNPQMGYDITTPHGKFRLHTDRSFRVRGNDFVSLWRTPLFGVVRHIRAPFAPDGDAPFEPDSGSLYRLPFGALVPVLALLAGLGLLPRRSYEWQLNMASVGLLLAVLVGVLGWFF